MGTRTVEALAGIGWLNNGIRLGRDNPKAVFGGAGLALAVLIVLMVPLLLLQALAQTHLGMTGAPAAALSLLTMVIALVLSAFFMVGYLRLLDAAAHGRPVAASDVFNGLRDLATSIRAVALMLLITVLHYLLLLALLGMFAPQVIGAYVDMLQLGVGAAGEASAQAGAAEVLDNLWVFFAAMIPLSLFFYAVQSVGLGQIALRGRGVLAALADGVAGAARNALPLLLFAVFAVIGFVIVGLLIALVAVLLAFVAGLVGTWLQVTLIVLAVPVYLGMLVAVYALMFAAMYCLWRDVCGGSDASEMPAQALTA